MEDTLIVVLFIVSFLIAAWIVNKVQELYMKLIVANTMFFSGSKKLIAIFIVAMILLGLIASILGIV